MAMDFEGGVPSKRVGGRNASCSPLKGLEVHLDWCVCVCVCACACVRVCFIESIPLKVVSKGKPTGTAHD